MTKESEYHRGTYVGGKTSTFGTDKLATCFFNLLPRLCRSFNLEERTENVLERAIAMALSRTYLYPYKLSTSSYFHTLNLKIA